MRADLRRFVRELQELVGNPLNLPESPIDWICGIAGGAQPSRYSQSPELWNSWFHSTDFPAHFLPFDVATEMLVPFLTTWLKAEHSLELTITDPFKGAAYDFLEGYASVHHAREVLESRTLNHLQLDPGTREIHTLNTDGIGMVRAIMEKRDPSGAAILLIGCGATGLSIAQALRYYHPVFTLCDLQRDRAERLAGKLRRDCEVEVLASGEVGPLLDQYAMIILAIPAGSGLSRQEMHRLSPETLLVETRYGSHASGIQLARQLGHPNVLDGHAMLKNQFKLAAEHLERLMI